MFLFTLITLMLQLQNFFNLSIKCWMKSVIKVVMQQLIFRRNHFIQISRILKSITLKLIFVSRLHVASTLRMFWRAFVPSAVLSSAAAPVVGMETGNSLYTFINSYQMMFFTLFALLAGTAVIIIGGSPRFFSKMLFLMDAVKYCDTNLWFE